MLEKSYRRTESQRLYFPILLILDFAVLLNLATKSIEKLTFYEVKIGKICEDMVICGNVGKTLIRC